MLKYAFTRKHQLQLIVCFGIEHAFNEFTLQKDFSKDVLVEFCVGTLIDAGKFDDFEKFYDYVSYKFEKLFDKKYKLVSAENKREY